MTPPPGVENVKIQENSEKNQGTSRGPLGTLYNPFLDPKNISRPYGPLKKGSQKTHKNLRTVGVKNFYAFYFLFQISRLG